MGSEEEEFGILVAESDGASSKERKNVCNGEDSVLVLLILSSSPPFRLILDWI